MSKRLQVVLEEEELAEIRRAAEQRQMTVSEWVRRTLREARGLVPSRPKEEKLEVIRRASEYAFPTADIDQMLAEVEDGYLSDS